MHACSFDCGLNVDVVDVLICTNLFKNIYIKREVASLSAGKSWCCGLLEQAGYTEALTINRNACFFGVAELRDVGNTNY